MAFLLNKALGCSNIKNAYNNLIGYSSILSSQLVAQVSQPSTTQQVREASKKAGGSCKRQNFNRKRKGKRRGPKVLIDQFVQPGQVLFRQSGFKMHPGRNVDYGSDHTLFALREGYVKVSQELVEVAKFQTWYEGPYVEKTFMHVLERPKVRRLVCLNPDSLANVNL